MAIRISPFFRIVSSRVDCPSSQPVVMNRRILDSIAATDIITWEFMLGDSVSKVTCCSRVQTLSYVALEREYCFAWTPHILGVAYSFLGYNRSGRPNCLEQWARRAHVIYIN